jgi:hypothetical protein
LTVEVVELGILVQAVMQVEHRSVDFAQPARDTEQTDRINIRAELVETDPGET